MRVLILHDETPGDAGADELDVLDQVRAVTGALERAGHSVESATFGSDAAATKSRVLAARPDAIFNLVETVDRSMRRIATAPALYRELGIPFTGSAERPLHVSTNKLEAKAELVAAGIPTPPWTTLQDLSVAGPVTRWIVKSVWEHGSFGLEEENVVEIAHAGELRRAIEDRLHALGGEGYAEAYVDGREFNLALLEVDGRPVALPPAEIAFHDWPRERPRIVGWRSKWAGQSFEYTHTSRRHDFPDEDAPLLETLRRLAARCWSAFALSGYARVDFRVDPTGSPFVLEVNANPTLAPDAGFAAAVLRSGRTLDEAILCILNAALTRTRRIAPAQPPIPR